MKIQEIIDEIDRNAYEPQEIPFLTDKLRQELSKDTEILWVLIKELNNPDLTLPIRLKMAKDFLITKAKRGDERQRT